MKFISAVLLGLTLIACNGGDEDQRQQPTPAPRLSDADKCATAEVERATATPDIPAMSTAEAQGTPFENFICPA